VQADFHVAVPQFARYHADTLLGFRVLHPQKILGQQVTKAAMNLTNAFGSKCKPAVESSVIDPFLHRDMRLSLNLQIALALIVAIGVPECVLDIDWVRVVSFNEVGIVAVHLSDQIRERRLQAGW
jgi:hypothetical protein